MTRSSSAATSSGPGSKRRGCDNLFCLSCDHRVVSFDGFRWDRDVDYLFLRNNFPDVERLKPRLIPARRHRAYACQCRGRSVAEDTDVAKDGDLKWTCLKHTK